jgi:hypothetical protein
MQPCLIRAIIVVIPLILISGCASVSRPVPPAPSRCWAEPDQLEARTRLYPGVEENQALLAADRLLRLSGQDDMKIERSPHSITAEFHRERWFYLFLVAHRASVWDHWLIATRPEADGTRVCVQVRGQTFTDTFVLGAEPITNAVYPAHAVERNPGKFFKPPAHAYAVDFDTFWARLDYFLGLTPDWASCPSGGSGGVRNHPTRGRLEVNPLCHSLVDDPSPPAERQQ